MPWNDGLQRGSAAYGIASSNATRSRVIAGPGTGKSFSLRRRVARLIEEEDVDPSRILAVTFTRIAAEDIRRELQGLDVQGADAIEGRTLHSLAMKILSRRHVIEALGRETQPMGSFEIEPLLYDLSSDFGDKNQRRKRLDAYLAAFAVNQDDDPLDCADQTDRDFRRALVSWLTFHQAMHIGELIPFLYSYLRDNPAAREFDDYDHVLVDEFQDLNRVEQSVIEAIGRDCSVVIVGDENQSIYSFKHAHPEGILQWDEENPGREDHQLVQCYRCPRRVVSIANSLIANNPDGGTRPLEAMPDKGEGIVRVVQFNTSEDEADGIVADIVQKIERGIDPGDILVLTTRKILGMEIADRIREAAIACREYLSESVLQTEDVTERLALLLVTADQDDRPALRWLLGRGHPSFRASQYARVRSACEEDDESPWTILDQVADGHRRMPNCRQLIDRFREIRAEVQQLQEMAGVAEIVDHLFPQGEDDVARMRDLIEPELTDDTDLQQLTSIIWEKMYEPDFPEDVDYVRVMTLFGSKGLGTPVVYVTSLNDGLMPSLPRDVTNRAIIQRAVEEQRRLFYVAITRAKVDENKGLPGELILSSFRLYGYDESFKFNGGNVNARASRFFSELGPDSPRAQRVGL